MHYSLEHKVLDTPPPLPACQDSAKQEEKL
jgi:hypothetical protein